jgi:2-dehydropantoate 2-reductase
MKILIYGAGVIGSIFAYKLKTGGNDVTVLARGKRLEQLRKYGIIIKDVIVDEHFETGIKTTDKLKPDDYYDAALIIMQRQQVSSILPVLSKNSKIPFYIFTGNNVTGAEEYVKFLDRKRILLGFGGPGGYREDNYVISAYVKDHTVLYLGEPDGSSSQRVDNFKNLIIKSGINVNIPENIDAWLKTHAAFISALVMASYAAKNKGKELKDEDRLIKLSIIAFKENLKALIEIGIPILPKKFNMMRFIPEYFLRRKIKDLIGSEFGRVALSGHADAAKDEMVKITEDFRNLIKNVKTDMSTGDYLYKNSFGGK